MEDHVNDEVKEMKSTGENGPFQQQVKTICDGNPLQTLNSDSKVSEALDMMRDGKIGAVPVVDDGKLVGIFTERDLVNNSDKNLEEFKQESLKNNMTTEPTGLLISDDIAMVIHHMQLEGHRHVPVLNDDGQPVDIISVRDILLYMLESFPKDLMNLPPQPQRSHQEREGGS